MADHNLILGIFEDEAAADAAVASLKASGTANSDAIGVLVLDESGNIKTHKVGTHSAGKGAGIGLLLGLLGPVGIIGGTVGGSLLGLLHHKGLGLDEDDRTRISGELAGGKAAVGVLATSDQEATITAQLKQLGGAPEVHAVTDEALQEAATATASSA
jgi:hypothetical protein